MYEIEDLKNVVKIHDENLIIKFTPQEDEEIRQAISVFLGTQRDSHRHRAENRAAANPARNNFTGIGGEFIAHRWAHLCIKGYPRNDCKPDLTPYSVEEKSWNLDLIYDKKYPKLVNLGCKTCDDDTRKYMKKCGDPRDLPHPDEIASWLFGYKDTNGSGGRDPLMDQPDSTALFVFVDLIETEPLISGRVLATGPWYLFYPHLELPTLCQLHEIKRSIYFRKLQELAYGK